MDVSLNMFGTYDLNEETIDIYIDKNRIGNYALGYVCDEKFYVCYVGRAECDLCDELKSLVNKYPKCNKFKFSYANDIREAYIKECKNWHDFGGKNKGLLNNSHPNSQLNLKCPYCED